MSSKNSARSNNTSTTISHASSATSVPSDATKKETAEERGLWFKKVMEDAEKKSQRELREDVEKHGYTVMGKGIPYDTDEDIEYVTGRKLDCME